MKDANAAEIAALAAKKEDAEANQGDMEVLDALFDAAKYHARIGDKDGAYAACDVIVERPKISTGKRIDAVMLKIRVGPLLRRRGQREKAARGRAAIGGRRRRLGPQQPALGLRVRLSHCDAGFEGRRQGYWAAWRRSPVWNYARTRNLFFTRS